MVGFSYIYSCSIAVCLYKCMKNIPYKTANTNGLPDEEDMMFETCRKHQELN
jgi:hypothetical protein